MKNNKPSHKVQAEEPEMPQKQRIIPTRDVFRLSDEDILEIVKDCYIKAYHNYRKPDTFKRTYVDIDLPIDNSLVSKECRDVIRNMFIELGYPDDSIRIDSIATYDGVKLYIKLGLS